MLTETGVVTKVENNMAWVNTQNKLACSSCKVESSCGNGILEKYLAGRVFVSQIENTLKACVGDEVTIGIEKSSITKSSLLVYGAPLFGLFIGSLIGQQLFSNEAVIILLSLFGFGCASFIASKLAKKLLSKAEYHPVMLDKVTLSVSNLSQLEQISFKAIK